MKALNNHECGSSAWICIDHFSPDDYIISNKGKRVDLKHGAVPSIFNIVLIEFEDDESLEVEISANEFNIEEVRELKTQNEKMQQEAEQLKRKYDGEILFSNSRINYLKEIKQQQAKEIQELKKTVKHLQSSMEVLKKEKDSMFGGLNVNIDTVVYKLDI